MESQRTSTLDRARAVVIGLALAGGWGTAAQDPASGAATHTIDITIAEREAGRAMRVHATSVAKAFTEVRLDTARTEVAVVCRLATSHRATCLGRADVYGRRRADEDESLELVCTATATVRSRGPRWLRTDLSGTGCAH